MAEINYPKKQLSPIIKKYGIDVENDSVFNRIINLFNGLPNYQIWGVKLVYSNAADMYELEAIKDWAGNNHQEVKKLSKGGSLTSYKTSEDIHNILFREFDGLERIMLVKRMVNVLNTDQRKILAKHIGYNSLNGLTCFDDANFMDWYYAMRKFSEISQFTRSKVIKRLSPVRDVKTIMKMINDAAEEKYEWNKEDLLQYVSSETPSCDIVINEGNIVVLAVKNYQDANKLCYGRTSWCITSSSYQWDNYVTDTNGIQYFLFDFSKPEEDELAHIGFTVTKDSGFYAAHSTNDYDLLCGITYKSKDKVNIKDAIKNIGLHISDFVKIPANKKFKWNVESFKSIAEKNKKNFEIVHEKDGIIVAKVLNIKGIQILCGNNFIPKKGSFYFEDDSNVDVYIFLNFNKKGNDENSVVMVNYAKDEWGIMSRNTTMDAFGFCLDGINYPQTIGINDREFINFDHILTEIILHKYISEGNEDDACELLNDKDIDVNYKHNGRTPIFSATDRKMFKLVEKIISSDKFDFNSESGFGDNFLQNLLYACYLDCTYKMNDETKKIAARIITAVIDSNKIDINHVDGNDDTVLHIAATNRSMNWIVEKLVADKNVNINLKNDIGWTPLGNAIRKKNTKAIQLLSKRDDLVVTKQDRDLANKMKIDLEKLLSVKSSKVDEITVKRRNADAKKKTYKEIYKSAI